MIANRGRTVDEVVVEAADFVMVYAVAVVNIVGIHVVDMEAE